MRKVKLSLLKILKEEDLATFMDISRLTGITYKSVFKTTNQLRKD